MLTGPKHKIVEQPGYVVLRCFAENNAKAHFFFELDSTSLSILP